MKFKYISFFICFSINFFSDMFSAQAAKSSSAMFSLLSWNILGPNTQDVDNFFPIYQGSKYQTPYSRLDDIVAEIKKLKAPYILCLQEIDRRTESVLDKELPTISNNYKKVGYKSKGQNGGVILYARTDKFHIHTAAELDLGNGGSAVVAVLQSKTTQSFFIVTCLHLSRPNDNSGEAAGRAQLERLLAHVSMLEQSLPLINTYRIFAGDFNTNYPLCIGAQWGQKYIKGTTIELLEASDHNKLYQSVFNYFLNGGTVEKSKSPHAQDYSKVSDQQMIDYILIPANLMKVEQFSKIIGNDPNQAIQKQVPSDHAILYGVFLDPVLQVSPISAKQLQQQQPTLVQQAVTAIDTFVSAVEQDIKKATESLQQGFGEAIKRPMQSGAAEKNSASAIAAQKNHPAAHDVGAVSRALELARKI